MPNNDNDDREPWENEDGTTDWATYEEENGSDAIEALRDHQDTDDSLRQYMDESGHNDHVGRDPEDP